MPKPGFGCIEIRSLKQLVHNFCSRFNHSSSTWEEYNQIICKNQMIYSLDHQDTQCFPMKSKTTGNHCQHFPQNSQTLTATIMAYRVSSHYSRAF